MKPVDVLIDGSWRPADASSTFRAVDPVRGEDVGPPFPVSRRADIEAALAAGRAAAEELLALPAERRAVFLETFADRIERRAEEIVREAETETALPAKPRLADVELPRTTGQLRLAAEAARDGSWMLPTIDPGKNIRSRYGPLGAPVVLFGPNNFPLAFNAVSGGDFAAAIAAGSPVIAKGNPGHPSTTRCLAEEALAALRESGLPLSTLQLLYHMAPEDGERLVSDARVGAIAYTGSRASGLALKAAADAAGRPIFLELSSVNPVFILPGALRERSADIAGEYVMSLLMAAGQFCTNPGLVVLKAGAETDEFVADVTGRVSEAAPAPLLGRRVLEGLVASVAALREAGAELLTGGAKADGDGLRHQNTLLRVSGARFIEAPEALQREAFGNCGLLVVAGSDEELEAIASRLEGSLTGCVYSDREGSDDRLYDRLARRLRPRVGRLLNDKMPTGVAVCPAMHHGGPFPSTGHPAFTAVGIPASLRRFAMLECYDGVRSGRLPPALRDRNPTGRLWRLIDGQWTTGDVEAPSGG